MRKETSLFLLSQTAIARHHLLNGKWPLEEVMERERI
jgi:hypothetical protein